jgi:hypothetical protein
MIVSIQTYGYVLLRFHPHLHCLVPDGLFLPDGSFLPTPAPDPELLMRAFRHGLLKAMLAREIITERMVELLFSWRHPGFSVYRGQPVQPEDTAARERLARYILHAPFSQEKITYDRSTRTIACVSQKNKGNPKISPDGVTVLLLWIGLPPSSPSSRTKGSSLCVFTGATPMSARA